MSKIQWEMQSVIGPLYIVASALGVCGVYWQKRDVPLAVSLAGAEPEIKILAETVRQLEEYFRGDRKSFDLPLAASGTEFQQRVWGELKKIPFGETCSYGDIARRLRNEKAVRAVGAANGKNPISIIVPCHRVIGANGSLTGFAGGLDVKSKLLDFEKRS